ncbi:Rha family transcriptional regulator [Endozoicomonas atrinae]|uniref:Rha family transcriptional regulator n=1 Tax=Endozoicomonas atrinae TaxID=1333660 RepID=UPI003B00C00B
MSKVIAFAKNDESTLPFNNLAEQTMTSQQIAQIVEKRHVDVKRDIKNTLEKLEIDVSRFARIYFDSMNREQTEYELPFHETMTVITGYDVNRRSAVIQRWVDLETGSAQPNHAPATNAERLSSAEQRISDIEYQLEDPTNRIHLTEPPEGYACASVLQEFIPYSFSFVKKTIRYFKLTPVYYITQSAEGERYPVRSYNIEDFMTAAELVEEEAKQISRCYKEHPIVGRFRNR